jgi:hypothetical protein
MLTQSRWLDVNHCPEFFAPLKGTTTGSSSLAKLEENWKVKKISKVWLTWVRLI